MVRTPHVPGRGAQVSRGQEGPAEQPAGTSSIPRSSGTRPCIVAGCTYHGRTIKPHFYREHVPKILSLGCECYLQVQVLNRLAAELRYTSLQLLVDSVFTSLDVKDLTFNEALVAAMQKLSLHIGMGVPKTTADFLRQRSPAVLLHWRVLGSLLNRMSEKRRAGFAKWDPPVLPLKEARDLVVRSIDRLLDEEEEMDQSPTPMEPKLTIPTSDPSMAADKEQPRGVVSASCTPAGAAEARTVDPPAPTSPTTTASPKPKATTPAVTPRPAPTSLPMLEVYDSHFHLDRMMGRDTPIGDLYKMQPSRAPELPCKVKGGAAIFCDPAYYPHRIQAAFQDKRFAVAVGLHPRHVASLTQDELGRYKYLVKTPRVGALGEVGLDYTAKNIPRQKEVLQEILREHLYLSKPVILHLRGTRGHEDRTYETALEVIRPCLDQKQPIQLHCFSGGSAVFPRWQKHFPNVYASFSGLVTSFSESQKLGLRGSARRSPPPRDRLAVLANEGHQKRQYPSSYWGCRRFGGRNPARASSRRYRRSQR